MKKAAIERFALQLREEVEVALDGVFDPYAMADLYGVDVHSLTSLESVHPPLAQLVRPAGTTVSGALLPVGGGSVVIVENDEHTRERRRATVSHELAHIFLEHKFAALLVNESGCRTADRADEADANELAAELLLPSQSALRLAWKDASDEEVAALFDVSVPMARWRMNLKARTIVRRTRAKRGF